MRYGRYGWSHLCLRLGLALTFIWIGVDIFRQPDTWIGYVPEIGFGVSREAALTISGAVDIALGLLFIWQLAPKTTALVAAVHLVAVIGVHGLGPVLIRDVGLLGAALALLMWPQHYRRHRWRSRLPLLRRKSYEAEE